MYTRGVAAVSVIIPAYRVTEYIAETLESVFAQTFRDFEIVVVNDGCPDSQALESVLEPYRVKSGTSVSRATPDPRPRATSESRRPKAI